jgi:hypothetical protein
MHSKQPNQTIEKSSGATSCVSDLASRRSVGVDAALDLGDAFLVAEDHGGDGDCASHDNRYNRDQQAA